MICRGDAEVLKFGLGAGFFMCASVHMYLRRWMHPKITRRPGATVLHACYTTNMRLSNGLSKALFCTALFAVLAWDEILL